MSATTTTADDVVTIIMSERVTYEVTLTHARLAEVLGMPAADIPALLDDTSRWSQVYGPGGEDNSALLEVIDQEQNWDSAEDREWSVR